MSGLKSWIRGDGRKALTIQREYETLDDGSPFLSLGNGGDSLTDDSFMARVQEVYKASGPVFACILARQMPFSEARFQVQEVKDGRPGKLRNTPGLAILDSPWPKGTTGELLSRMEQDASLSGNFYAAIVGTGANRRLRRLRPDYVSILSGVRNMPDATEWALEAEVLAYFYTEPGRDPVMLTPDRIVHYAPIPDPEANYRGMSWLTPLAREVAADHHATTHKLNFFQNGAALSAAITYDKDLPPDVFKQYVAMFEEAHRGPRNAFKTLHIGGGSSITAVGTELKDDFKAIQGAGETRIAAAAGVGAIMARFSEGMAGSALNQGNYSAAKRQFGDMTLRPLWRSAAASLAVAVPDIPATDRLWYDARDVEFLKEDRKDAAEIRDTTAKTISTLVTAGYTPESVITAVETDDMTRLEHSGRFSVQLLPADGADNTPGRVTE